MRQGAVPFHCGTLLYPVSLFSVRQGAGICWGARQITYPSPLQSTIVHCSTQSLCFLWERVRQITYPCTVVCCCTKSARQITSTVQSANLTASDKKWREMQSKEMHCNPQFPGQQLKLENSGESFNRAAAKNLPDLGVLMPRLAGIFSFRGRNLWVFVHFLSRLPGMGGRVELRWYWSPPPPGWSDCSSGWSSTLPKLLHLFSRDFTETKIPACN